MKKIATVALMALPILALVASGAFAQVRLNEIRVDHGGADVDEYVEFAGPAGTPLTGMSLVVIGDGTGGCGIVEVALDLSPYSIQADGYLAIKYSAAAGALLTGYDVSLTGSFENSDNLTFLLVTGNTAATGNDLDSAPEDGVLDSAPWTGVLDSVALTEGTTPNCTTDEHVYSTTVVGPDGTFAPGHIYFCPSGWLIGGFGNTWPTGIVDTPGAANPCVVPNEQQSWGSMKQLYQD